MVNWSALAPLPAAPTLFVPQAQIGQPGSIRIVVSFGRAAPPAGQLLTIATAWQSNDVRILFIEPNEERGNADWQGLVAVAENLRRRTVAWVEASGPPRRYLLVTNDGKVQGGVLSVTTPSGRESQMAIVLPTDAPFSLANDTEGARIEGDVTFVAGSGGPIDVAPDAGRPALEVDLSPARGGVLGFSLAATEETFSKLEADCRYFVKGDYTFGSFAVDAVRYPLFAPLHQPVALRGELDPTLTIEQVRLSFSPGAAIRTHLQTDEGERVEVRPAQAARLASQSWPAAFDDGSVDDELLYLTPRGSFVLVPPPSRLAQPPAARRPFRLLLGFAGTEFVHVADFDASDAARTISFDLGDSFVDTAPWEKARRPVQSSTDVQARHLRGVSSALGRTAHLRFHSGQATYYSQAQRAPLFAAAHQKGDVGRGAAVVLPYAPTRVAVVDGTPLPIAPLAGLTAGAAPSSLARLLAASRVGPSRLETILQRPLVADAAQLRTTPQGFVATISDGRWTGVKLATTSLLQKRASASAQAISSQSTLELRMPPASELAAALLDSELRLAVSRWEQGTGASDPRLSAEQWTFDVNVRDATSGGVSTGNGILIFKFQTGRLRDVIDDPQTFRTSFNPDPTAAQTRVKQLIEPALQANPESYWLQLKALLHDPKWTGIVVFDAKVAKTPSELAGLVATMSAGLRITYLAIPRNRVDGTLSQREGNVSGLIDYEDDTPLISSPYDLRVQRLRVLFADNRVALFECRVALKADEVFFVQSTTGTPNNVVHLEGRYEAHGPGGGPTYTFQTADGQTTVFNIPQDSVIERVTVRRIKFVSEAATVVNGKSRVRSRLTLRGELAFDKTLQSSLGDIFSFDALGFDDLWLDLVSELPDDGPSGGRFLSFDFRAPDLTLDFSAGRRLGSFLKKLPLELKGFLARLTRPANAHDDVDIWSARGFVPMFPNAGVSPHFALIFSFDLGSLGALVDALKGLRIDIAVGWKGRTPVFAMKFPEMSGGERAFGIEGFLRVLARDLQFHKTDQGGIFLLIREGQLEVLGQRFPGDSVATSGLIISDPQHRKPAWVLTTQWTAEEDHGRPPFVALGQSIKVETQASSAREVVNAIRTQFHGFDFVPPNNPPAAADDVLTRSGAQLKYDPNHDWLLALHLVIDSFIKGELDLVLNDPSLYGVHVEFATFHFDLLYRRVADGVGMFHVEAPIPLPAIKAGALKIGLPHVGLSIFTNGGFKLDLGFPANMDFARGFQIELPPFGGAGGFYFARYASIGSDLLPDPTVYQSVLQAGIGFRVGYAAGLAVGPFTASASISIYAMLEGALGFRIASPVLSPDIAVRGRFGIMASLRCHLDLLLTALDFALDIWAGVELVLRIIGGRLLPIEVTFEVGVRIHVRWVIARFRIFGKKIEIAITLRFERTIRYTTMIEARRLSARAAIGRDYAALSAGNDAWRRSMVDPDYAPEPIVLYFVPEASIARSYAVHVVAQLAIERAPDVEPTPGAPPVAWAPFDKLLRAVLRWAARADHYALHGDIGVPATYRFTQQELKEWRERLGASHSTAAAGLTYDVLLDFLTTRLPFTIDPRPQTALPLATFPVFSELVMRITGGAVPQESRFDGSRYTDGDVAMLTRILRMDAERDPAFARVSAATGAAKPLSELLFEEYFEAMAKTAIDDLCAVATDTPASLDDLIAAMRATPPPKGDAFAALASSLSTQTLHGMHVPAPSAPPPGAALGASIYERTGQSVKLFDAVPASFPGARRVTLQNATAWAATPVLVTADMADADDFAQLQQLDRLMRDPSTAPALPKDPVRVLSQAQKRARAFAIANGLPIKGISHTVFGLPRELLALLRRREEPFQVGLYCGVADAEELSADRPTPVTGAKWLLRVEVVVQRPGPEQHARHAFALIGTDDPGRRVLELYLNRTSGAAGTVSLYQSEKRPGAAPSLSILPRPDTLCVMTNTARRPNPGGLATFALPSMVVSAGIDDADAFLRLLWSASIVRDGGFTLVLPLADTEIAGWDASGRVSLTLIVDLGSMRAEIPRYATAIEIPDRPLPAAAIQALGKPAPTLGYSLQHAGSAGDRDGTVWTPLAKPGRMTLELVRPNPERLHAAVPALGIQAGLRHDEIRNAIRDAGPAKMTSATKDVWLAEANDPQASIQLAYRLLAMRIIGDASPVASYRRPLMPRAVDDPTAPGARAPADIASLPDPLPLGIVKDDWAYRTTIDLRDVVAGKQQPYDLVGTNLDIDFFWRDAYGNDGPSGSGFGWRQSIPIEYLDRLIPVGEWPHVTTTWEPVASASSMISVAVEYLGSPDGLTDEERAHYDVVLGQMVDPRVEVWIDVSIAATSYRLASTQRRELTQLVVDIGRAPTASHSRTLVVPRSALALGQSRTELTVKIRFVRAAHVASGMPCEVTTVDAGVRPEIPPAASGGVKAFSASFNGAFHELRLAVGDDDGGQGPGLWALNIAVLQPTLDPAVGIGSQWARFFAPRPISKELLAVDEVPIPDYDPAQADAIREQLVPLRGLDPDVLMRGFLDDLESALRADAFAVARAVPALNAQDAEAMDAIVRTKFALATVMKQLVLPLYKGQPRTGLDDARDAFAEALRKSLRNAYAVDTIVQFELDLKQLPQTELLYGDIVRASGVPASTVEFSRARIWHCPNSREAKLTVLLDETVNNAPGTPTPAYVEIDVELRITHVAQPEDGLCGDDIERYRGMRWLQIVEPLASNVRLRPNNVARPLRVPLPLRVHPPAPTVRGHRAENAAAGSANVGKAQEWVYRVELGQEGADTARDRLLVTTHFERYSPTPTRRTAIREPDALQSLGAALAGWQRSAAAVMKDIESARSAVPTPGATVFRAYRYLRYIVDQVSRTLEQHLAGGSSTFESAGVATDDVILSTRPNPPPQTAASGRKYQIDGSGSQRILSVGATGQGADRLGVLEWSAATADLRIDRNAELIPGSPSDERFVYTTERVAAGDWARAYLDPEILFRAAVVPASGTTRLAAIASRIEGWLTDLTQHGPIDLSVRCAYAFDPSGLAPSTFADLALFSLVPLCFLPGIVVSAGAEARTFAANLSAAIDPQLPIAVVAQNAGVLLELTVFTHTSAGSSGDLGAERAVLTLRGLWIPFAT